ncbi:phosphoadenosine phosphosulfate reductase family protein [Lewinella sp. LCG006]|uniref:phosphoadenosine phosphosulfate reductase domain-containing protein n=1 Tax=Lewinella sp. LCG006 TaxID=3231911 RepID=UPI003460AAF0
MSNVRHVIGISGGKDSSALAIYLSDLYGDMGLEYYFCDTGKELEETYQLIKNLESYLGFSIIKLRGADQSHLNPFDHFLQVYGGYLPSSNARWCTKKLKLDPFEKFVGDDPVISYVGIRGDEDREGYISRKNNIQSIFPFRRNIWSEDVIKKVLANNAVEVIAEFYRNQVDDKDRLDRILEVVSTPLSFSLDMKHKLDLLLNLGVKDFNHIVFRFIKEFTDYPLSKVDHFPLIDNEDNLIRDNIFEILENSGVGVPAYYKEIPFEDGNNKGTYARSRSGCFFCFFQQKIEWVWLYEQHPDRFAKAMEYEKDGFTWMDNESLSDLIEPKRLAQIKADYILKQERNAANSNSPYLLDRIEEAEGEGCAACFI